MNHKNSRIGLLATGNELTEGDILNIDGQLIAQSLVEEGLSVGLHVVASDQEADIEQALHFLLEQHGVIIITGGLGPTSDDRTRYVLSKVIGKELVFDELTWQRIEARFAQMKLAVHPSNRQQALFPEGAHIISNAVGSAAGCWLQYQDKAIYMLPGPPSECLPMFREAVLPALLPLVPERQKRKKLKWRLLGAIEADIAAQLDEVTKGYPVTTGYRIDFPYLEVKLYIEFNSQLDKILNEVNAILQPYLISDSMQTAVELLKDAILLYPRPITICDQATGGRLQSVLVDSSNYRQLQFSTEITNKNLKMLYIKINGLQEYWNGEAPTGYTTLTLEFIHDNFHDTKVLQIPYRNPLVIKYAVEYSAKAIFDFTQQKERHNESA